MRESEKTNARRTADFIATYLTGRIIDIGSGSDPVTASAERFDVGEGDANEILKFRPAQSYDCVYSSHCLEHMKHPLSALKQWWALVKPGGYLVLVVPHEDLYEQGYWPSLFNRDHKATFRISKSNATSWSPVSIDLHEAVSLLPESEIISEEIQHDGYDYRLQGSGRPHLGFLRRLATRLVSAGRTAHGFKQIALPILRLLAMLGTPVDQTRGSALAQIQIVAHKRR
jgi:SAM-dependent methyltransferase